MLEAVATKIGNTPGQHTSIPQLNRRNRRKVVDEETTLYEPPIEHTSKMANNKVSFLDKFAGLFEKVPVIELLELLFCDGNHVCVLFVQPLVAKQDDKTEVALEGIDSSGLDVKAENLRFFRWQGLLQCTEYARP